MKRSELKQLVYSIVDPYLGAKKDSTILKVYKRAKPNSNDRIRTSLSNVTTETSRLASSETFLYKHSTNLQNLPKLTAMGRKLYAIRDCFIPDPGMLMCAYDYDKAEMIAVCAYAKDWEYYDKLHTGADVHSELAEAAFGSVTPERRQICKSVAYLSNYKGSAVTATRRINVREDQTGIRVTVKQVEKVQRAYYALHPFQRWWQEVDRELNAKGYLRNALGFKREFFNPNPEKRLREACAFLPQSTVAQVINRAMTRMWNELDEDGVCELLLQVHDELVFQIREDLVLEKTKQIREIMEETFEVHGRTIFIPTGGKVGERWGDMEDINEA